MMEEYKAYRKDMEKRLDAMIDENIALKNRFSETKENLYRLSKNVTKPMLVELSKSEIECRMLRQEVKERTQSLKVLFSMIRSPKMCDILYKTQSKIFAKEKLKELNQTAVFNLRQYSFEADSAEIFTERVYKQVHEQVNDDKQYRLFDSEQKIEIEPDCITPELLTSKGPDLLSPKAKPIKVARKDVIFKKPVKVEKQPKPAVELKEIKEVKEVKDKSSKKNIDLSSLVGVGPMLKKKKQAKIDLTKTMKEA